MRCISRRWPKAFPFSLRRETRAQPVATREQVSATHGIGVSAQRFHAVQCRRGRDRLLRCAERHHRTRIGARPTRTTYGSAVSYIPEIPWNDSCAGSLLANYMGYSTGYGANGFCNSNIGPSGWIRSWSRPAAEVPATAPPGRPPRFGVSNGTCQGYAKPVVADRSRRHPQRRRARPPRRFHVRFGRQPSGDIIPSFVFPTIDNGGSPCTGAPSNWAGFGGTSVASPVMAGIQALVNQNAGGPQGNPNYVYYALAASTPSVFHSITQGDIDVNCGGTIRTATVFSEPSTTAATAVFSNHLGRRSLGLQHFFHARLRRRRILELRDRARQRGRV